MWLTFLYTFLSLKVKPPNTSCILSWLLERPQPVVTHHSEEKEPIPIAWKQGFIPWNLEICLSQACLGCWGKGKAQFPAHELVVNADIISIHQGKFHFLQVCIKYRRERESNIWMGDDCAMVKWNFLEGCKVKKKVFFFQTQQSSGLFRKARWGRKGNAHLLRQGAAWKIMSQNLLFCQNWKYVFQGLSFW